MTKRTLISIFEANSLQLNGLELEYMTVFEGSLTWTCSSRCAVFPQRNKYMHS